MVSSSHRWAARALPALLAAVTLPVLAAPAVTATPPGTKDVTATLFQWRFDDVARACTDVLGPEGYGFVEVSPASEHIQGPQWWTVYQPVSYRIAGRLGDRAAFANMVATCHDAGVKVIADAVVNHMSAGSGVGTGGTSYSKYNYPGHYQDWDFHSCRQPITDYRNRDNVQNCELVHLSDLDTGSEYVRSEIAEYLADLRSLGVDGFRIDAAKHMSAGDLAAIKSRQANPGYWVQEVIHGAGEAVQPEEYLNNGDVDEFRYATGLKSVFAGGRLADLSQFGEAWGFVPSAQARSFVDNWDTERNGSTLNRTYGSTYTLANVFMLAWPYGSPNVYSGYEFSGHDDGPPLGGDVRSCYQDGWTCQHAWRQIANMVGFRNAVSGTGVTNWWSNGNNAIAFGRGAKGYVVINREPSSLNRTFQTSLPAGTYCDVQHAEPSACSGHMYTVGADGRFTATVGAGDAIALHATSAASTSGADFAVNATTTWGQNIFVVGNHPSLGNWSPSAAIPLSSTTYPIWRASVTLPAGTRFEYKYLRKTSNGSATWESGPNRVATVPSTGRIALNDTWRP
ncbi:carbohydrate-binding module family 20 domain-containing protein [Actinokineospora fastidiosa]|uniref:Alpha-amylase n=1 Tax=Actinokineospora fastidiosa TaxID=1816 RepID=A0A918GE03_9PSEU|nr:carbohydrate-binding module family 20 domain-containing protein [Actinokineospora fastidiosa]GGS32082.1 alpha-amylase [Actinokineospora fastidiosa]